MLSFCGVNKNWQTNENTWCQFIQQPSDAKPFQKTTIDIRLLVNRSWVDHVLYRLKYTAISAAMKEATVGEWQSPITSQTITSSTIGLSGTRARNDGYIYYTERRPSEKGRTVIMRQWVFKRLTFLTLLASDIVSSILLVKKIVFSQQTEILFHSLSNLMIESRLIWTPLLCSSAAF